MSKRTGVIMPDDVYEKYLLILVKEHKTRQQDLLEHIKKKIEEYERNNEQ